MEARTILIVDDEPDILRPLRYALSAKGYQVVMAGDAEEALTCLQTRVPDFIFLDLQLPRRLQERSFAGRSAKSRPGRESRP